MLFLCRLAWGCWKTYTTLYLLYHLESRWLNSNMYWLYHFCPFEIAKILGSGDRHLLGCNSVVGGFNPKNLSTWIISPARGEHQTTIKIRHKRFWSGPFSGDYVQTLLLKRDCFTFLEAPGWRFRWLLTTWSCVGGGHSLKHTAKSSPKTASQKTQKTHLDCQNDTYSSAS